MSDYIPLNWSNLRHFIADLHGDRQFEQVVVEFRDGTKYPVYSFSERDSEVVLLVMEDSPTRPALVIDGPPYFEDDQECGYCQRPIGKPHETWCRQ